MATAVADLSLQRAVHSKWTQCISHFAGHNKDAAVSSGLLGIAKAWNTVVNYMRLPSITELAREFSERIVPVQSVPSDPMRKAMRRSRR
ncbi:hypothetical protein JB92DRAFT_17052 [Gautieria morchelliformis]|nr:hypothetical protein JB92DRAFT_17052 [Gautieria morchelliformis]